MAGVTTNRFRIHNAKQFYEQFEEASPSKIYYFIARSLPWSDDTSPPTPVDTTDSVDLDIWNRILSLKKVTIADTSYCIPRIDWTSGTVYQMYTINSEYHANSFYVTTDDYHVYKCLNNNGGVTSTVKPTSLSTNSSFTTSDGYRWKYMYTISAADAVKFLTTNYMPIPFVTANNGTTQWNIQQNATNGSIEVITPLVAGSGYLWHRGTAQAGNTTTITLGATANSVGGSYIGSQVYISSGTGAGQLKTISSYNGTSKLATVNNAFSVSPDTSSIYIVGPKVVIQGDGSGALAWANTTAGSINKISVINIGQNYSYANVTLTSNGGSSGTGIAHISPKGGHGANALYELAGHNIMLNVKTTGSESNTFMILNDFRILGLMVDPIVDSTGEVANGSLYPMTTYITLANTTGTFTQDEKIIGSTSNAYGYVVEYTTNTVLSVVNIKGTFANTETITGNTSSATSIISGISSPTIRKFEGDIIYMEYRSPITRTSDQQEDIKFIIKF